MTFLFVLAIFLLKINNKSDIFFSKFYQTHPTHSGHVGKYYNFYLSLSLAPQETEVTKDAIKVTSEGKALSGPKDYGPWKVFTAVWES